MPGCGGRPDDGGIPESGDPSETGPADRRPAPDGAGNPHIDDWPWTNDAIPGSHEPACGHGPGNDAPSGEGAIEPGSHDNADPAIGDDSAIGEDCAIGEDSAIGSAIGEDSAIGGDDEPGEEWPGGEWPGGDSAGPDPEDSGAGPVPWPEATPLLPPGPAALKNLEPVGGGYLDLRLPWLTLIRAGPEPGYLTRLGPITSVQANYLALLAAADPAVEWRVVITNDSGRA